VNLNDLKNIVVNKTHFCFLFGRIGGCDNVSPLGLYGERYLNEPRQPINHMSATLQRALGQRYFCDTDNTDCVISNHFSYPDVLKYNLKHFFKTL
jgi:hypothetical protein